MIQGKRRRGRRTWPQRLLISFNILLVVLALLGAGALSLVRYEVNQIPVIEVSEHLAPTLSPDEPRNFLIIGTDSAQRLDPNDPANNDREYLGDSKRADVIMILRVVPTEEEAYLLSIPRDTYVELAPSGSNGRINEALALPEGPAALIDTIKLNYGIDLNNYVQVDFRGFRDLVEVLDGVPIYLETPVRDRTTGLLIEEAGCVTMEPFQALAYARSRSFQYQDENGAWRTDPTGDLGRMHRQQDFLRSALHRAVERGVRNPATALEMLNVAQQAVLTDNTLSVGELLDVGNRFRTFNPDDLQTFVLPTVSNPLGGVAYQEVVEGEAEPILDLFRGSTTTTEVRPETIRVEVLNGTGVGGQASEVSEDLVAAGFSVGSTGDAESLDHERTTIQYSSGHFEEALLVARHLDADVAFEEVGEIADAEVILTTGQDYGSILAEPRPVEDFDYATTTTAPPEEAAPGSGAAAAGAPASTTVPVEEGVVVPTGTEEEKASCR